MSNNARIGWCGGVFHTKIARSAHRRLQRDDSKGLISPERYVQRFAPPLLSRQIVRVLPGTGMVTRASRLMLIVGPTGAHFRDSKGRENRSTTD